MDAILDRRSIRKYTSKPISRGDIEQILRAGMSAPSAGNERPWQFIVLNDRNIMEGITKIHPYSQMLKEASHAIIICCDMNQKKFDEDYWVEDCSAAAENMIIMAQELGIGSVWLGVYPTLDRVEQIKRFLNLPENVTPFSILALGYPAETKNTPDRYEASRVHWNKW